MRMELAALEFGEAKAADKLHTLGKDRLAEIDGMAMELAAAFRPLKDEDGVPYWKNPGDEARFNRYLGMAIDCARARAPYESPRYTAIALAAQGSETTEDAT